MGDDRRGRSRAASGDQQGRQGRAGGDPQFVLHVHQTERDPLRLRVDDYTEVKFAGTGDGPGAPLSTASMESEFPAGR